MTDCVLYARVSTKEQQDEGYSLDAQQKALKAFCEGHDLHPVAAFVEAESASKPGRSGFAEMVTFFAAHPEVRSLVVHKLDRLARNWADRVALDNLGVRIRCVEGDMGDSPEGQLCSDMQQSYAVYYSRNLSREVKKGTLEKVAQGGWPHRAPLGYVNDKGTRTLVLDPVRAPLVAFAFERYATGLASCSDLAAELWDKGLRTRAGKRVSSSVVHKMLGNPLYCGLVHFHGELNPAQHEPIVTVRLFEQVRAAFQPNRNGNKQQRHSFLFRDFLTCADCGCKITAQLTKGHTYYRCTHGRGKVACSERGCVREEKLVPQVSDLLRRIALKPKYVAALIAEAQRLDSQLVSEGDREKSALARELASAEQRSSVLADKLLDGTVSDQLYREKARELTEQANTLKLRLAALAQTSTATTPLVMALTQAASGATVAFETGDTETRREVLALTLSNLALANGEIVSYQWKRPFDVLETDSDGAPLYSWWKKQEHKPAAGIKFACAGHTGGARHQRDVA